jgi:DNA-binding beta-propeller fold protein YncE
VYVSDLNNQRIQKFDADGNFITLWSIGGYNHATGVATDTSNNVYVYHVYAKSSPISQVEKYTSNGDLIKSIV